MSKTGYVEIASRLVMVAHSCFKVFFSSIFMICIEFFSKYHGGEVESRVVPEHESPKKSLICLPGSYQNLITNWS
jgi:general stress protein CsbA